MTLTVQQLTDIQARQVAFLRSHDHMNGFACCTAHATASDVPPLLAEVDRLNAENAELRHQLAVEDECVMAPKTLIGLGQAMTPAWHELYTDTDGHALQVFAGDGAIRIVTDPAGCTVPLGVVEATVRALREAARRSAPKEG